MANEIVLLLVGRTGSGKSSTANSVLGKKLFNTGKLYDDIHNDIMKQTADVESCTITVVDGTGIGDTGSDMVGGLHDTIQKAETAVRLCESGFNALIFVMTYGSRFTKQEKDAVDLIKSLFGRDIFRRFGIIVMTRGDQFNMDIENDPKTFDQWCREQTGAIKDLFGECNYRLALFDNKTKDEKVLSQQRGDLLKLVSYDKTYSIKDFNEAENDRKDIRMSHEFLETEKKIRCFLENITKKLEGKKSIPVLNDLIDQLTKYEKDVLEKYSFVPSTERLLVSLKLKRKELEAKRSNQLVATRGVATDENTILLPHKSVNRSDTSPPAGQAYTSTNQRSTKVTPCEDVVTKTKKSSFCSLL